jgi:uncharacterized protein
VAFLAIAIVVLALIHLYLWRRLVRDTLPGPERRRWRWTVGLLLAGLAALVPAALATESLLLPYERVIAWPGHLWLGIMFYLFVTLVVLEVPILAVLMVHRLRTRRAAAAGNDQGARAARDTAPAGDPSPVDRDAPPDPGRRLLLRRGAAITAGLVAAGALGYGVPTAYREPTIKRLTVPLRRLDPRADGMTIAVVADLHVGPMYGIRHVERVVELVNGADPDVVAVVGDMVSSRVERVRDSAAPLRDLRSRHGSYFVTGNHEYYTGHEEWIEAADDLGLTVLRNERLEIAHGGAAIDLAGVNDREGSRYDDPPDYHAALGDRDESRPVVLLAHQPVQVHRAAAYGVDLQLSGHTHGGQVFPFDLLVRLDQPVVSGLAEVDGTLLYVTNGAGFWGPPMRVGADPDITLVELRSR